MRWERSSRSSLSAEHWSDREGHRLPVGELSVEEDELLDPESLKDVNPEEEFEGYTGNAGMTLDRWYRHAAIFLWPESKHFEILCDRDSRKVLPVLEQMVRGGEMPGARTRRVPALRAELAAAIIAKWPEDPHGVSFGGAEQVDALERSPARRPRLDRRLPS